jgi:hypothetical protein
MSFFRTFFLLALFFFASLTSFSQTDTCHLRISLLTCGPGDELYSTFGHTGIRVIDSSQKVDVVFNYGMFDDSDPYFYLKFARGIMRYSVAAENFSDFMEEYVEDKRSVTEQELNLNCLEKINLFNSLKENLSPQNRDYDYHFYKDNCTTRAKEMIKKNAGEQIVFKNILPAKAPTFRDLIHEYLDSGNHSWDKLGIDLVLGSHLDEKATNEQAMFLPEYLLKGFDSATIHEQQLVSNKKIILASENKKSDGFSWFTPLFLFSLLAIIFIALSFSNSSSAQKILKVLDVLFFFFVGLIGLLIAFEWLGRVDKVCRNNMNILWAWPTHIVMAFLTKKKTRFIPNYFLASAVASLILLLGWFWWPQQFNNAFAPLLIIIIVRGFFISRKK